MPRRPQTYRPSRRTQQQVPPVYQGTFADSIPHRPQAHRPPYRTTQQGAPPVHRPPHRTTQQEAPPSYQGVFGDISSIWFSHNDDALLARAYATQNRPPPIPQGIFRNSRWSKILPVKESPQVPFVNRVATQEEPVSQGIFGDISTIWFTENDDALLARANATQNRPPPISQGIFKNSRWSKVLPSKVSPPVPLLDRIAQQDETPSVSHRAFGKISAIWFTQSDKALLERAYATQNRSPPIPQGIFDNIGPSRPILPNEGRVRQVVWSHVTQVGAAPNVSPIQGGRDMDMEEVSDHMDTDPPVFPSCPLTLQVPEPMDVDRAVIPLNSPATLPMPMDVDEPSNIDKPSKINQHLEDQSITLLDKANSSSTSDLDLNHRDLNDNSTFEDVLCDPMKPADEESLPPNLPDRPVQEVDLPSLVDDRCDPQTECDQMEQLTECFRLFSVSESDDDDAAGKTDPGISIPTTPVLASDDGYIPNFEWLVEPIFPPSPLVSYTDLLAECRARKLDKTSEIDETTSEESIFPGRSDGPDDTSTDATSMGSPQPASLCPDVPELYKVRTSTPRVPSNATRSRFLKTQRMSHGGSVRLWLNECGTDQPVDDTSYTPQKTGKIQVTDHCICRSHSPRSRKRPRPEHILYRPQPRPPMADRESCATVITQRDDSLQISDTEPGGDPVFPGAYALEDSELPSSHYPYWRSLSKWILGELMCGW